MSNKSAEKRLEAYTIKRPQEILKVTIKNDSRVEEILIFKGFSSYLSQATPTDPEVHLISENAMIITIDRLKSPYRPNEPEYIQKGLSWEAIEELLEEIGV